MENTTEQKTGGLPPTYEHESSKGDTYIVQPLVDLKNIPGLPEEFLDKALMIRDGQLVHMTKKPLTEAEKVARKAERDAERAKMAKLKDGIEAEFKAAMKDWRQETARAAKEFRDPSEAVKLRAKKLSEKWDAVKSTRTLEHTKEVLDKFQG